MTLAAAVVLALLCLAAGVAVGWWLPSHRGRWARERPRPVHTILLPFSGEAISRRAFEAAVRLARAEHATIVPVFLARVPLYLPLDAPVPRQAEIGMPLLEAIEQRARAQGVEVDARVSRGRSDRHALRRLLAREQFDRVIVSASDSEYGGLKGDDLRWLVERVPAEVVILRPAREDHRRITAAGLAGHF
jgi:nucleotide-binding universal stress UspA family protein